MRSFSALSLICLCLRESSYNFLLASSSLWRSSSIIEHFALIASYDFSIFATLAFNWETICCWSKDTYEVELLIAAFGLAFDATSLTIDVFLEEANLILFCRFLSAYVAFLSNAFTSLVSLASCSFSYVENSSLSVCMARCFKLSNYLSLTFNSYSF